ncbi:MAG: spore protease YyaC [Lachnospiraceae bacterium]|nr:spore protease YyaC [Lachnospiraceae bacterium]
MLITKNKTYYYNSKALSSYISMGSKLRELIDNNIEENQEIIILCIGSDRSTGDSLGPIVGYKLSNLSIPGIHVYGTLNEPVHAVNLHETIDTIYSNHKRPFIIAVDASLGTPDHIGLITLCAKPLKPGLGVKKSLPEIGQISITGIVNLSGLFDNMLLQSTRLHLVMSLADVISLGIFSAFLSQY